MKNRAWIFGAYRNPDPAGDPSDPPFPLRRSRAACSTSTIRVRRLPPAMSSREHFANNTIPSSRFNSVGKSLTDRYPDPNRAGRNNYCAPRRRPPRSTSPRSARTSRYPGPDVQPADLGQERHRAASLAGAGGYPVSQQIPSWNVGYGYTRVFGPTLVNEFRFAWSRPGISKDATAKRDEIVPGALAPASTAARRYSTSPVRPTRPATGRAHQRSAGQELRRLGVLR